MAVQPFGGTARDTSAPSARDPSRSASVLHIYTPSETGLRRASRAEQRTTPPLQNGELAAARQEEEGKASWRMGVLLLLLRGAALCFSAAAAALAATDGAALRRAPFRFLLAADAIVAVYSAFEAGAAAWELATGGTMLPEAMQLWFDFGHDQGFGYMALAAAAAAARDAAACGAGGTWRGGSTACLQADVAVGLGFAGFAFLALAALVTGFRLACFLVTGSRFPPPSSSSYRSPRFGEQAVVY